MQLNYYVHTDHLGAPRKITRPSDNGLMWRWDTDTFGSIAPNSDRAGFGTFTYNLRYPGQYSLNESGLYYNDFRDYDPQMGRYVESDPIGLYGGSLSTNAYTNGKPISGRDPTGLTVEIIGSNPVATQQLQGAYNQVANTMTGGGWINALPSSPLLWIITDNPLAPHDAYTDRYNNVISIDPNFHPPIHVATRCGTEKSSAARIMGHEIAHAAREWTTMARIG
jgi:RHS repeat-associated protein